jgi:two-component system, NarL family, invasion response regulator UvrY
MMEKNRQGRVVPQAATIRLLVVDDHAAFRQTVRHMFDASAVEITEASSGEEAVALYGRMKPDWVIMDLRMPGIGGIKATEAIRELDPQARVLVISQFTEPEYRNQAERAGALAFVSKEEVSQLVSIIHGQGPQD